MPLLHYNWVINAGEKHPNWRTSAETRGRGGALSASFDYELAKGAPITAVGAITEDEMWANLTYFLNATIPAAERAGVRMALHPTDPQVPSLAGVARIVRSVEDYERVFRIVPSSANTVTFCLGCFAQMLDSTGVYGALRRFGSENRIAFVHFRNVEGTAESFRETYWDEGKLDMVEALRALRETGYEGYLIPDHAPRGAGDTEWGHRARAFALGYMRGLLQAVSTTVAQ